MAHALQHDVQNAAGVSNTRRDRLSGRGCFGSRGSAALCTIAAIRFDPGAARLWLEDLPNSWEERSWNELK